MKRYIAAILEVTLLSQFFAARSALLLSKQTKRTAQFFSLATLAATLMPIVLVKVQDRERSNVGPHWNSPPFDIALTANEIATLLWLMRRGKQRFAQTSESIGSMFDKGIIVRPWSGCRGWMVVDRIWNKRDRFMSAREMLPTPESFPQNGMFL
ncbi:hypothetical protein [Rhizobium sp. Root1220]|uniref:hypothetical protein n=1 Tax=Rhizobium sp. Root1220 TaxID=1736432 RepID=UPI0006F45CA4|nr:hypothetical protein [Rhizobium sp. Root1220]KQV80476.1 hypothetical protein ASC90_25025 [Rhizobium sp. Root1220]